MREITERKSDSCLCCLDGWSNFKNLAEGELAMVSENRYEATFKPGEIIMKQGSPASNAIFIRSGMAKMYIEGPQGRNLVMGIGLPGRLIAGPGTFVNSRNSYSVSAISMVQACFVSFDIIRKLIRQNSLFAEGMIEDISMKSYKTHMRMLSLAQKRMHGRMAEALLMLADDVFGSDEFELLLSRQDMGDLTNMAKESVVRILKDLEEEGIIDAGCPMMRILDRERLKIIAEKG